MLRGYTNPITQVSEDDFIALVDLAYKEDLPSGDITTDALFSSDDRCQARLFSKGEGILCGLQIIPTLIKYTNADLTWKPNLKDGDRLKFGIEIGYLQGSLPDLLKMERILLNFIQYLSGISTNVWKVTSEYPNLLILDTRKTLPGYRKLAKYAVYIGGGANHRLHLSDMVMLKDNHIAKAGNITKAVKIVRDKNPTNKIELEIDSLDQLDEAIVSNPDILLLDNFSEKNTEFAIKKIKESNPKIQIECSGGITPDKLKFLSKFDGIGVSMGYLTHTVGFLDISLDII